MRAKSKMLVTARVLIKVDPVISKLLVVSVPPTSTLEATANEEKMDTEP